MLKFMKRCLQILLLAFIWFATPALAQDRLITLNLNDGSKALSRPVPVQQDMATYTMDLAETLNSIDLSGFSTIPPEKIEIRTTVKWAVGEEGPWIDLEGIDIEHDWKPLPAIRKPIMSAPPKLTDLPQRLTPHEYNIAIKNLAKHPEIDRWLPVFEKCKSQDDTTKPCYAYQAQDQFRFTYSDQSVLTVTIAYPGGC